MATLSRNDYSAVLAAIETIYNSNNIDQFPNVALSAVRKTISCNTICYNEVDLAKPGMFWITEPANALPNQTLQETFNRHLQEHPLIARSDSIDTRRSLRISDFLSQQQFHRLAIYNEYYRPLNVEYQLGTTISISRNKIMAIALDRDRPDFSENESLRLNLLRPHLIRAYQNMQKMSLMQRSVKECGKKLVIVNRSSRAPVTGDDFWQIMAQYRDISHSPRFLPDIIGNWIACERSRFNHEIDAISPSIPLILRNQCGKLVINFMWGGKAADWDILLVEEKPIDIFSMIPTVSKLTRRETDILERLSNGRTNAQIGLDLSISPRTVKKHLEHIYEKLKVHRRSAAIAVHNDHIVKLLTHPPD